MTSRPLNAETMARVERSAFATRNLDPELRTALDYAYHDAMPDTAMTARLLAEPVAFDYAPDTMRKLSGS